MNENFRSAVMIIVRMKSTRLPEKALKILKDRTMIEQLIERMKLAKLPDEIIICTSENPQDDALEKIAEKNNVKCFRGSEDDVLKRMLDASQKFNIDFIANTTGDNPLTDPLIVDRTIEEFSKSGADYITSLDLPLGAFCYGIKVKALEKVVDIKKESDTEIWGDYFKTNMFNWVKLDVPDELRRSEIRLTVDTPEDFEVMKNIFNNFQSNFSLADVIRFLDENPEIKEINSNIEQRKSPERDLSDFNK